MNILNPLTYLPLLSVFLCCQVRHERPQGFIGVWPDLALLRHSCAPNSSVVVVGKHLLLHATADLDPGTEVTFNKLGRWVM
jgi:SET and MYND domain-containing protein